ncbi:MAG: uL30 family ribosomal protein [Saprospiraceae bacterium]|nr:uL30 family ribosomal protein [Saprospiraceae bacterium]
MIALGVKKLHNPVVKEVTPQIMGMVDKVRHLDYSRRMLRETHQLIIIL